MPEGDEAFGWLENGLPVFLKSDQDLGILPLGQDSGNVVVQVQQAFVDTLKGYNCGDELAARCYPIHIAGIRHVGIGSAGLASERLDIAKSAWTRRGR